jgi:hypothetical protein
MGRRVHESFVYLGKIELLLIALVLSSLLGSDEFEYFGAHGLEIDPQKIIFLL